MKLVQASVLSPSSKRNTRKKKNIRDILKEGRERERGKDLISPGCNVDLARVQSPGGHDPGFVRKLFYGKVFSVPGLRFLLAMQELACTVHSSRHFWKLI